MATVLKTVGGKTSVGSNPTSAATYNALFVLNECLPPMAQVTSREENGGKMPHLEDRRLPDPETHALTIATKHDGRRPSDCR